ncbi:MAG: ATP-dependent zinc metalloprotease FtsH [Planctomycetes bacterium]|nr:ATP-dependent zinc metalloprotease FtsH [Planctomycetota bacterium]
MQPNPPPPGTPPGKKPPPPAWRVPLLYMTTLLLVLWLWQELAAGLGTRTIPYSEFKQRLAQGEVVEVTVSTDEIVGKVQPKAETLATQPDAKPPTAADLEPYLFRTTVVDDPKLTEELEKRGVKFVGVRPSPFAQFFWGWLLPLGVLTLLFLMMLRRAPGQGMLSFGRSKAKLVADKETGVTFADVAGCDEAKTELREVVEFLKTPERFRALGAKIPKGVLLVGPPGTGKTLLARAVAGEAGVPFFQLSGSDFVEMFVGVGAARVRDLFVQAKAKAPCIIFIDELDAIGRARGVHVGAVNDEREQTLNQLLVEMDGFEANAGVILLAATNRPDVLDRALLRPGRFDRQVVIDAPDIDGREAILRVHVQGKPLEPGIDLRRIAKGTPGFSGADLANTVNEAALLAARRGATKIAQKDLEEAIEKVVAGPERRSRRLDPQEKERVAYHEVGHALVAAFSKYADPVVKISIVPRGRAALGYTLQVPEDNQFLMTRSELLDRIKGLLGGRAAEDVVFSEVSTGAANDLERATDMARQMVCMYGMSDAVGLTHCGRQQGPVFLGDGGFQLDVSAETAQQVDAEVRKILDQCYAEARGILSERRTLLETITRELLSRETLDAAAFQALVKGAPVVATEHTDDVRDVGGVI